MPSDVETSPVLARKTGLAVVDGEERVVILDLERPAAPPVVLAGSGRAVWEVLEQPRAAAEVVVEIAGWYDEPVATVEASVLGFIDGLIERGLLVPAAPKCQGDSFEVSR